MLCGMFPKSCNGNNHRDGEEPPFIDCWDWRHEESDILQQVDPLAQTVPVRKVYLSENLPTGCVPETERSQYHCTTSPVRDNVDLTKYQLKSPRVTTPMM